MIFDNCWHENRIVLHGTVATEPTLYYKKRGGNYYIFQLTTLRRSKVKDVVNVVIDEVSKEKNEFIQGASVTVEGEVRTYNKIVDERKSIIVTVKALFVFMEEGEDTNEVALSGVVCKHPIVRTTPLGRTICDMLVAVEPTSSRASYLPCLMWGVDVYDEPPYVKGDKVQIEGRLQSRIYTKRLADREEERTTFEISISNISEISKEISQNKWSM